MILVTGATGLVGSHLLYKLLTTNQKVTAIYRRKHKLEAVKKVFSYYTKNHNTLFDTINWVKADITDIPELSLAFQNITHVYHCAAFISFEPDKYQLLRKINIEGTANVVNLCIANNIKKLCYVSTVAALGNQQNPDTLINEDTPRNADDDHSVYAITKYGAELEVWRGMREGIDSVIVNPGVILGRGFWNSGGSSNLFKQVYLQRVPYFTNGYTAYVDIDDVIEIMYQLMNSAIKNERFIVISENMSFKDFLYKTANALNVKAPQKEATRLMLNIGWRLDWLNHKLRGKRRKLSKQMATSLATKKRYDNRKITAALNFKFKPIDNSIKEVSKQFLEDLKT